MKMDREKKQSFRLDKKNAGGAFNIIIMNRIIIILVSFCIEEAAVKKNVFLGLVVCWFAAAAFASAELAPLEGLADYQVFQRDENNTAAFSFRGETPWTGEGVVETRVQKEWLGDVVQDWTPAGKSEQGKWNASIHSLPVGGPFRIDVRIKAATGEQVEDRGVIHNVLVGDLWILAGQSNMQGYGVMKDVTPPSTQIYMFGMDDRWQVAETPVHRLYEATDGVYHNPIQDGHEIMRRQRNKGACLALPFAQEMLARTGVPVGLIPCAHGGTSMDQWSPDRRGNGGDSLYGATLRRVQSAGGKGEGMLWHQSEAEASPEIAPGFKEKFAKLIAAFRRDFNQPDLPFYYAQIGRYVSPDSEWWNKVQDLQRQSESVLPPPVGMASTIDLRLDDAIHVGTPDLKRLGIRMANLALRDLFGHTEIHCGPRPVSAKVEPAIWKRIVVKFDKINGKLVADGRLNGFSVRRENGEEILCIYDQYINPDNPTEIFLDFQVDWSENILPEGAALWYGYGKNPYCNLRDERDMACPMFGPMEISR
jgi:sialate O-acetylesterase